MKKAKLLGKGMTAEVYELENNKVLKLFYRGFSDARVKREAEIGHAVHHAGVPSPAVYDIWEVNGRKGIVLQKIFGETVLRQTEKKPWRLKYYAEQMAEVHLRIHKCSADGLPSQKKNLISSIKQSSCMLGNNTKRIIAYLENLPDGTSVCHGDLHYDNIMLSNNSLIAIDWPNACLGNPLGDVARTCLTIRLPTVPPGTPAMMFAPYMFGKWLTYQSYLHEYMKLSKIGFEQIDAWMLPVAAAKLREKLPGEEIYLMNIINEHLESLDI